MKRGGREVKTSNTEKLSEAFTVSHIMLTQHELVVFRFHHVFIAQFQQVLRCRSYSLLHSQPRRRAPKLLFFVTFKLFKICTNILEIFSLLRFLHT